MNTSTVGSKAESAVAVFLEREGYRIIARNWKHRSCEIDIVAFRDDIMYMVEVKYRSKPFQGEGLAYITYPKARQMGYAARLWASKNNWQGPYVLSGAAVSGPWHNVHFVERIA